MEDKTYERILIVVGIIAFFVLLYAGIANAAGTVCQIANGCVGTSTAPSYGKVLVGDANGNYELTATSSLGFPAGGSGTVTSVGLSSPNSTLTVGSTPVTTSGTFTNDLNLTHTNWWTARQNFTNATTSGFEATSTNLFLDGYTSVLLEVNSTHQVVAYGGASACSNQFVTALSALGATTCASINNADWSGTQLSLANGGTNATSLSGASAILAMNSGDTAVSVPSSSYTLTSSLLTAPNASTTNLTIASFLTVPTVTSAPSFTTSGELVLNKNSVASSSISFADGTNNYSVFAVHSMSMLLASSTLAYDGAYGPSGTTTLVISNPLHKTVLQSYFCETDIGTVYVGFGTGSATTTETQCTSSGTQVSLSSNNSWNGRQKVYLEVGYEASTPNQITITADVQDSN